MKKEAHPILCFNMGSSSLKFALYEMRDRESLLVEGEIERIGLKNGRFWMRDSGRRIVGDEKGDFGHHEAIEALFSSLKKLQLPSPSAAGHRIVHGGPDHDIPALIDAPLLDELRNLIPFAPLHMPGEIKVIDAVRQRFPELPQVACFDTAFHRRMPEIAERLPLERQFWNEGVRRYGFHGLSYEYIIGALGKAADGRVVIAHLGNGASMAAVKHGHPMDTTMGFTPAGGFMMGTRSGDLDPGVLLYLMREKGYDSDAIDQTVNRKAGLLGVSGSTSDMKILLEKRKEDTKADQAIRMFCYQIRKNIGSLAAVLGGLDVMVFTGGIGEKAGQVRSEICEGLDYLGILIDEKRNRSDEEIISIPDSTCSVRVIQTKEDLVIARHTRRLISVKTAMSNE